MIIKGIVKQGEYYDSVSLMLLSKDLRKTEGITDSAVVMGTKENKAILEMSGMLLPEFKDISDNDLLICLKAEKQEVIDSVLGGIDGMFKKMRTKDDDTSTYAPKSLESALKSAPGANLSLISVAGRFAAHEAMKALKNGLHVMIFSDNVTIEEELELKKYAASKGLLVMGPDCGTAIINGAPLAFANVVNRGNIGIVAASGTGLQEVSCVISNFGAGISQAIGTGGRDLKKEIGGIMFLQALLALNNDPQTEIIVLISKPPHEEVLDRIVAEIKKIKKPVVAILIGGDSKKIESAGAIAANTLEETGMIAAALAQGKELAGIKADIAKADENIAALAIKMPKGKGRKYIRGLFSGGTLCDETQLIFKDTIGFVYGNSPLNKDYVLDDVWKSKENCIIDLGEDEFTVGRPHPMIDFSLRNKKILDEAAETDVAVILLDVVLGYGSNLDPAAELVPVILKAKEMTRDLHIVCSITGTEKDPQNRQKVKKELEMAGAIVMPSNAAASKLSMKIIQN
ncbi:MAG: acyl-CoA synthetase FdrA [Bacteroidota bacterium]